MNNNKMGIMSAFPIQILMIAVAVGTSVGINALLSKSIGAGEPEVTKNIATSGVILALIGTILFMILGFSFTGWFTKCFTNDSTIQSYTKQYLSICMIFCAGSFIGTMYQRFLQSVGDTFSSMVTLIVGAIINLILDPILIFGLPALRIISITFTFASVTMILGYAVSGLGNGIVNMLGTAIRQFIVLVPLIFIIAKYMNINYVWYAFWFSELIAMLYAIYAARKILRQKNYLILFSYENCYLM